MSLARGTTTTHIRPGRGGSTLIGTGGDWVKPGEDRQRWSRSRQTGRVSETCNDVYRTSVPRRNTGSIQSSLNHLISLQRLPVGVGDRNGRVGRL